LGQHCNTIKNYEMGRLPRLQVLVRLAAALDVTIDCDLAGLLGALNSSRTTGLV
jgi:transcriptional regulator with XRE-family HTH domain